MAGVERGGSSTRVGGVVGHYLEWHQHGDQRRQRTSAYEAVLVTRVLRRVQQHSRSIHWAQRAWD
jgi:hypothetical protein